MSGLWDHQKQAIDWALSRRGAMLAMDMGTGKSRVAIETWERLGRPKTLIVAPKSVVRGVWPAQIEQWRRRDRLEPRVEILDSAVRARNGQSAVERKLQLARLADVAVINYESAWRQPLGDGLRRLRWGLIALDESHRIKSPGGKASRYIARLCSGIPRRLALTGTPMPHSPMDIYAQYRAIAPGVYGVSAALFRSRYAVMGGFNGRQIVRWQNADDMARRYREVAFEARADDVLDLPPAVDSKRTFELSARARRAYSGLEREFWTRVEGGEITVGNALVELLRLAQITSGYLVPDGSDKPVELDTGKRELLADIVADMPRDEKLVVFCRFRRDLDVVASVARASMRPCYEVSGRMKEQDLWRTTDGGILATQMQAGSLGLDLTAARTAVFYSVGFSLGEYLQARARLRRPGQIGESVQYIHLIAEDSVDKRIMTALAKRQNVIKSIMEAGR